MRIANCEAEDHNSRVPLGRATFPRLVLIASILTGWLLRLPLLDRFPFREDEAIYSYWALHFWRVDPFFLHVWPDKPPVFIGLLAATFQLLGANQLSARWLNIAISTATIPLVAALAHRLAGPRAGAIAALALALNPFAISFAPTAYTDPLLVLTGLLALYFALRQRPFRAGLCLALAIMTKQQGLLYIPLVIGALFLPTQAQPFLNKSPNTHASHSRVPSGRATHHSAFRILHSAFRIPPFLLGLALVLLPILYWDSRRWAVAPSPWDLSIRHYGALTLLPPSQWLDRLHTWLPLLWHLTASWPVWMLLLALFILNRWRVHYPITLSPCHLVTLSPNEHPQMRTGVQKLLNWWRPVQGRQDAEHPQGIPTLCVGTSRLLVSLSPCLIVFLWALGFLAVHLFTSLQPWDRYLLPLAPLLALGIGGLTAQLAQHLSTRWWISGLCAGLLVLLPPAWQAAQGRLPIGGDHGAYAGLIEALDWVKREQPVKLILYQRVLGWHYHFYLYDQATSGAYELRWFANPVYLAANAAQAPGQARWLIEPAWAANRDLRPQLARRGLRLEQRARFGQFTVYALVEQRPGRCRWCYCGPRLTLTPLTSADDPGMMSLR